MRIAHIRWREKELYAISDSGSLQVLDGIREENLFEALGKNSVLESLRSLVLPEEEIEWLPVVCKPSKIIGIGLNYIGHIRESSSHPPKSPVVFAKFPNSLVGHKGSIRWSKSLTQKVDYEAELAVIIGRVGKDLKRDEVDSIIAGYCCANDISARDLQFGDTQWTRGKSLDTFCPLGPHLVTHDELPDPQNLEIELLLNGIVMQKSRTSEMIFSVKEIVSFLSRYMTLFPGDVILTGTPPGVGAFRDPPVFLKDGDEVIVRISGIGELKNYCRVLDE